MTTRDQGETKDKKGEEGGREGQLLKRRELRDWPSHIS